MVGTADTVVIREVSLIRSVLCREVPLYTYICIVKISVLQLDAYMSQIVAYT